MSDFVHKWDVSIPEATAIQKTLREKISLTPLRKKPRTIAGADISFARYSDIFYAGIVVLSLPTLEEVDHAVIKMQVKFPYVPGYLSFREIPPLLKSFEKLKLQPDVLMMDGHGIAHPRRLGVAAHLGLVLDMPVFGCAKSKLFGVAQEPRQEKGSAAALKDPKTGEDIGALLRTKEKCLPVIVSPGHRITLEDALALTILTTGKYRIPEPTRRAHEVVNAYRRKDKKEALGA